MIDHNEEARLSEELEMKLFFEKMRTLYRASFAETSDLYDRAFQLTQGFRKISEEAVVADTRIIKILRYIMEPALSQMKLGQLVDLSSTSQLEESAQPAKAGLSETRLIARKIAGLVTKNVERNRFPWLDAPARENEHLLEMAKAWTCSLAANQNAATDFRNERKEIQEEKAVAAIKAAGYKEAAHRVEITKAADLACGYFSRECKIVGRSKQKADLAVRTNRGRLLLLEAKAIGVRVDSFKRIKECREKAGDWRQSISSIDAGVVIAGFVDPSQLVSLENDGILVFWEHRIERLTHHLREGT
jgi:hypothetical protein